MTIRFGCLLLLVAPSAFAINIEFNSTVAKEALDSGDYATAKEKCKQVLAEDADNADCKFIIQQVKAHQAKVAKAGAAQKVAKEKGIEERHKQQQAAEEKEKQRRASPEYNSKKACACNAGEAFLQSKIIEEQKVGAIGGYVDKVKLHQLSSTILMLEKVESYYKSRAGGSFDSGNCAGPKPSMNAIGECTGEAPQEALQQ